MKSRLCDTCDNLEFEGGCSISKSRKHCCYYRRETKKVKAINCIIDRAGGYTEISHTFGIRQSTVYEWRNRKRGIPKKYWEKLTEMAGERGYKLKEKDFTEGL